MLWTGRTGDWVYGGLGARNSAADWAAGASDYADVAADWADTCAEGLTWHAGVAGDVAARVRGGGAIGRLRRGHVDAFGPSAQIGSRVYGSG